MIPKFKFAPTGTGLFLDVTAIEWNKNGEIQQAFAEGRITISKWYQHDQGHLLQYTGQQDSEKIELYDRDICRLENNRPVKIIFVFGEWRITPLESPRNWQEPLATVLNNSRLVRIGNVFTETPE